MNFLSLTVPYAPLEVRMQDWVILFLCGGGTLVISFFCSMWEAALYAVSKSRVEVLKKSGARSGKKLAQLRENIGEPIAAILILNTISHTGGAAGVGAASANIASGYLSMSQSWVVGISSAIFTLLILFLSEIIPKTIGVSYANTIAPLSAYPIQWTIWSLYPIVKVCQLLTNAFSSGEDPGRVTEEELHALAQTSAKTGTLLREEARWVRNVLELDETHAADIMTPRTVMFIKDSNETIESLREEASDWIYSRIPIAPDENPDEIEGIVMRREVLEVLAEGDTDQPLRSLKRDVYFVDEDEPLHSLLQTSVTKRQHLFVVRDDYGGVAGIVTLEDVFEEIIGQEIMDETDRHADLQNLARLIYKGKEDTARTASEPSGAPDTPPEQSVSPSDQPPAADQMSEVEESVQNASERPEDSV